MSVINASYQNVVGSFFGAKWGKSIEELLVSPTPIVIILLAYITGGVARGALVGLIVTGVSLFFPTCRSTASQYCSVSSS